MTPPPQPIQGEVRKSLPRLKPHIFTPTVNPTPVVVRGLRRALSPRRLLPQRFTPAFSNGGVVPGRVQTPAPKPVRRMRPRLFTPPFTNGGIAPTRVQGVRRPALRRVSPSLLGEAPAPSPTLIRGVRRRLGRPLIPQVIIARPTVVVVGVTPTLARGVVRRMRPFSRPSRIMVAAASAPILVSPGPPFAQEADTVQARPKAQPLAQESDSVQGRPGAAPPFAQELDSPQARRT